MAGEPWILRGLQGGVISLTTGDSRRGSLGSFFRFLGLCVCLGVQRGLGRVLISDPHRGCYIVSSMFIFFFLSILVM